MQLVVCPGSFDPIHNGHVDIITRAAKLYGSVIVALAHNSSKKYSFSLQERVAMAEETFEFLDGVNVELMPNMLVADYAKTKGANIIVKGVRNCLDWEYEAQMASMNRHLTGVETVFLTSDVKYSQLSSTLIREVSRYNGDLKAFVPRPVQRRLEA
ncbi:MAG: pantetheine-phosphate adenylyltransferase [Rothia sp. (in: high G+C Gram-positive bacteria)]|nr:pantetheine-phosphate adenylyltransferase [Rothia sp. (in: high G+C Gram-positive bacteria)]